MSTASVSNGKPQRKQLSEQLDRFDAMLDGLSEGLGEAVAEAARTGTRLAVKDAIVEILTDPQLRSQLHQATAPIPNAVPVPATEEKPGFWARLKAGVRRIGGAIYCSAAALTGTATGAALQAGRALHDPLQALSMLGSVKRLLVLGCGVGMLVATLSYIAPHVLSAAVSGIGAAVTAMAVQLGFWVRRTFRGFSVA
jgi:hypothetical protein